MEKVIKDGKVAILVSYGYGAGWSTWNNDSEVLIFSPKLIEMVESGKRGAIDKEWCKDNLGIDNVYCGGAEDLEIVWLPIGTKFLIEEYDGSESLRTTYDLVYTA